MCDLPKFGGPWGFEVAELGGGSARTDPDRGDGVVGGGGHIWNIYVVGACVY